MWTVRFELPTVTEMLFRIEGLLDIRLRVKNDCRKTEVLDQWIVGTLRCWNIGLLNIILIQQMSYAFRYDTFIPLLHEVYF